MRADRLLAILLYLQTHGRTTAADLAERLEVSERTIYRDLDALSASGVPVYAERGPGGGCTLDEDYRTNLTGLKEDEVRSLFMSGIYGPLQDLGLGKSLEDAMLKLQASLPDGHRRNAEIARQRLHFDAASWNRPDEAVPHLREINEAVWQQRLLGIVYRKGDGAYSEKVVEPYGLVAKASIWYLVAATTGEEKKMTVFRVSRIQSVRLTDVYFERPEDFDLADFWSKWIVDFKSNLPRYPVKVRFATSALRYLQQVFGEGIFSRVNEAGPPDANGILTVVLVFEDMHFARNRLMGLGTLVEVLEPQELRDSILTLASSLVEFYSRQLLLAGSPG